MKKKDSDKLRYYIAEYNKERDARRGLQRRNIIDLDPNAPLCINCRYCNQSGFLFECVLRDEIGIVYYRRKGHKSKTYPNAPMKREECKDFEPLLL